MHLFEKPKKILAVYLINMAHAHERRLGMSERLSAIGLTAERIEAVDGKALTFPIPQFSEISYKLLHGRRTCPPEVGCYLSHVECARRLLRSKADFALILEDDVIFHDDFLEAVEAASRRADRGIYCDYRRSIRAENIRFKSSQLKERSPSP